jgi:hypothetical protein
VGKKQFFNGEVRYIDSFGLKRKNSDDVDSTSPQQCDLKSCILSTRNGGFNYYVDAYTDNKGILKIHRTKMLCNKDGPRKKKTGFFLDVLKRNKILVLGRH